MWTSKLSRYKILIIDKNKNLLVEKVIDTHIAIGETVERNDIIDLIEKNIIEGEEVEALAVAQVVEGQVQAQNQEIESIKINMIEVGQEVRREEEMFKLKKLANGMLNLKTLNDFNF